MTYARQHCLCLIPVLLMGRTVLYAGSVFGSVVDSVSRSGIAAARVQLKTAPGDELAGEATTNEKGCFVFENVTDGKYTVSAAADGYLAATPVRTATSEEKGTGVEITLVRAASITGTVMDPAGRPARGAKVSLLERRVEQGRARLAAVGSGTIVDDRGAFRLHSLTPGSYALAVTPPLSATGQASFVPLYYPGVTESARAEWFTLRPGETRSGVDLLLRETTSYTVSGLVTGVPGGWQAQRIAVALTPTDGFGVPIATVTADSAGRFRFTAVSPGSYEVTASGPVIGRMFDGPLLGANPRRATHRIEVTSEDVRAVEVCLGAERAAQERPANAQPLQSKLRKGSIAGTVTDAITQAPIGEAVILVMGKSRREVVTDAAGHYEVNDVDAGAYRILVRKDGYGWGTAASPRRVSVAATHQAQRVDFALRRGASVSGRVLDEDRKPVAEAVLLMRGAGFRDGKVSFNLQRVARTNDLGEYRFEDVSEGSYTLLASPKGVVGQKRLKPAKDRPALAANVAAFYANSPTIEGATPLTLAAGEQRDGVDVILPRAKTYCVSASVPAGATTSRTASMMLFEPDPTKDRSIGHAKVTGSEVMEVCGLAPGAYELYVTFGDGSGATVSFTRSRFDVVDRHVELGPLQPIPRRPLSGRVGVEGAAPGARLPEGILLLVDANGRIAFMGEDLSTEIAPSGSFTVKHLFLDEYWVRPFGLPAGHYVKEARCGSQNPKLEPIRSDCGELQFILGPDGAEVSGQALDSDNHPVTGATVVLAPAVLPETGLPGLVRTQETDQNGDFKLTGVAPGDYRVLAFTGLVPGEGEYPRFLRNHWTKAVELNVASRGTHRLTPAVIAVDRTSQAFSSQ